MALILRRWRTVALALVGLLVAVTAVVLSTADRRPRLTVQDVVIDVVDGPDGAAEQVRVDATLYLPPQVPAPAILVAHGFGGSKDSVASQARELAERGFVVLAYSARGFGRTTGAIALNAPQYEVADARQLVDWLATRAEVVKDSPGDPRVGVTGASYGGALALSLAGTDRRVDALVPLITWNDLSHALLPNAAGPASVDTPAAGSFGPGAAATGAGGVFKRSWAGIFFSGGLAPGSGADPRGEAPEAGAGGGNGGPSDTGDTSGTGNVGGAVPGDASAGGVPGDASTVGCGRFRPEVCQAYVEVATTGVASPATVELLRRASPAAVAGNITAPTLLVQGELDTLFGLDQADATARQIAGAGGQVKMIWYSGGHDGGAPGQRLRNRIGSWFGYHLAGRGDDPGTGFEYAVRGSFERVEGPSVRTVYAPRYPGLTGGEPTERRELPLSGGRQPVFAPPGGSPAALSTVPGLGSLGATVTALGGVASDVPGQFADFLTEPVDDQLLVTGAARVRLLVGATPGGAAGTGTGGSPSPAGTPSDAVLFVKLYDVGPDGRRTLPGGAVAPVRLTGLPADGSPVEVTVALPGVVRPVEPGHRLAVVVSTTDQAYATPVQPAVYTVALAGGASLSVPVVPGRSSADSGTPVAPLIGIAAVLGVVAVVAALAAIRRRRRADEVRAELADVPLVIEGLTKTYRGGLKAVDDLSFRVERGQVLGLLGPNGAGKTTTLRMLMGLIWPEGGEIRVFGHQVRPGAAVLARIGAFIEGPGFLPHLSGLTNLRLYWAATGRPLEAARMDEALEVAGLGTAVHRRVGTYSHGMKQRLAIAQAMLGMPDLLVLDEPTNGLDPPQIREMRDVLRRYATTGRTVVVSSHLLAEVEQTCTHVVVMHRGRLVASGEVHEIVSGGGQASFRVDDPAAAAELLRVTSGVDDVVVDGPVVHADLDGLPRSSVVSALVRAGIAVEQAGPRRRLEDAFLQLVGEEPIAGSSTEEPLADAEARR